MKRSSKTQLGELNPNWKGDYVGISSIHSYIKSRLPKPKLCENCRKIKPYDLSNISGKYTRDINNYEWLCRKCHMTKDGRLSKLIKRNEKGVYWKGGISLDKKKYDKMYYLKNRGKVQ